ncbi:hypothetical protein EON65_33360 [archaeon]|nr:MAG: hypothetical protein EON65_33360 [archaeon]
MSTYKKTDMESRPGKKGIRITNDVDTSNFSNDLIVMVKKMANIITSLLPLAQSLYESHFAGSSYQDNNTISELYKDMDEKMYVLTSLNRNPNKAR